jgi:hypothetical protein
MRVVVSNGSWLCRNALERKECTVLRAEAFAPSQV